MEHRRMDFPGKQQLRSYADFVKDNIYKRMLPMCSRVQQVSHNPKCCVSKAIHYFIPSLVAIVRGIYISLMIRFLYYNCLGFDLASDYTDIIPNIV